MKVSADFRVPAPPPWHSAEASVRVAARPPAAEVHPCGDCLAMCCWFVLIETGPLEGVEELDAISEHLDYERTVVWLQPDRTYSIGIISPCRHLERTTCGCGVHGTPDQPDLCRGYDASACWYRRHFEPGSHLDWARLDGRRWPAYRATIGLDAEGLVADLPRLDGLAAAPRAYEVPAVLQFDLPEDSVDSAEQLGDLLYYLSNFEGVELARTPDAWMLLFATRRDGAAPAREIEVADGRIGGFEPADVLRPTREQVRALFRAHGAGLWCLGPTRLAALLRA
jgi:hypothetical protein